MVPFTKTLYPSPFVTLRARVFIPLFKVTFAAGVAILLPFLISNPTLSPLVYKWKCVFAEFSFPIPIIDWIPLLFSLSNLAIIVPSVKLLKLSKSDDISTALLFDILILEYPARGLIFSSGFSSSFLLIIIWPPLSDKSRSLLKVVFLPTVFNISVLLLASNIKPNVPSLNVVGNTPSKVNSLALLSVIGLKVTLLSPIFNVKFLLPIKLTAWLKDNLTFILSPGI